MSHFTCTLNVHDLNVTVSCPELKFKVEYALGSSDDWSVFFCRGDLYEIHIVLEDKVWSASVYRGSMSEKQPVSLVIENVDNDERNIKMPKKKKKQFVCTLYPVAKILHVTCPEINYHWEFQFTDTDEWNSFTCLGEVYDVHLLLDGCADFDDEWSVSIYKCREVKGEWSPDYSDEATQNVTLVVNDPDPSDDDGTDEYGEPADCIAREYEWHCVHCSHMNIAYEFTFIKFCTQCGSKNKLREPEHAIG